VAPNVGLVFCSEPAVAAAARHRLARNLSGFNRARRGMQAWKRSYRKLRLFRVAISNQRRTILGGVGRELAGGFRDGANWAIPRWNAAMSLATLPALLRIERNLASALQDDPTPRRRSD
jgi:hypothetical protein